MPDFTVEVAAGAVLEPWSDPADGTDPPRIARGDYPLQRRRVTVGAPVTVNGLVGGALLADAALGGRLFSWSFIEWPANPWPGLLEAVPGFSATRIFFPRYAGHLTLVVRRAGGGSVVVHFDAT